MSKKNVDSLKHFIDNKIKYSNYWKDTVMENYNQLTQKAKGDVGEKVVEDFMKERSFEIAPSEKYNDVYDKYINGIKTEIKFSLSQNDQENNFMINHIKVNILWERFIFYGWNRDLPHQTVWCTAEQMKLCWKENGWWSNQSGEGEKMLTGSNVIRWINSPYTNDISKWYIEHNNYNKILEEFMNDS